MTSNRSPSSAASRKYVTSWKPMGTTRLFFSSNESETSSHGTLECSLSANTRNTDVLGPPMALMSKRIVPCPRDLGDDCFLLQSNGNTHNDENLHMGTINALLLSLKSAMLFQDDEGRHFLYAPRSLHTASLAEYSQHSRTKATPRTTSQKKQVVVTSSRNAEKENASPVSKEPEEETVAIDTVPPSELERLYQQCLETNDPTPRHFCQQVAVSLKEINDLSLLRELLVTSTQLQQQQRSDKGRRLLQVQIGLRLALRTFPDFLKLHHECVYKTVLNKKLRKKLKHRTHQQVLEEQVLNLLSLLGIRSSDSPTDFRSLVKELCAGASPDMVQVITAYFELNEDEEESNEKERVPAVTPATKTIVASSSPTESILLSQPIKLEQEPKVPTEVSILKQSISLTASQSTRKNPLVPNLKPKYVGSHFGTRLSNASTLFRQVPAVIVVKKPTIKNGPIKLVPRPPKQHPRAILFGGSKQIVSETPAKRKYTPSNHHALSPMGGLSESQNARLVAQEALKAARRKR